MAELELNSGALGYKFSLLGPLSLLLSQHSEILVENMVSCPHQGTVTAQM